MNLVSSRNKLGDQDGIREKIIVTADEFFARFGFQKTTMDEIARKIHKAKGALYYYFKGKEELYTEVIRREFDTVRSALDEVVRQDADPFVRLENYFVVRFKTMNQCVNYHETIRADFRESYDFVNPVREEFDRYERREIKKILVDGKAAGYDSASDLDRMVDVIMILLNSIEVPLYLKGLYDQYEHIIFEMTTILFNGLKKNKP
ncbi:MAG: TetR/AcrR family transcriptional regulator [Bacteroidales bacterium]|nr:TetR/AcrR family transcriptional regulator [Bacteroidales bacterium]